MICDAERGTVSANRTSRCNVRRMILLGVVVVGFPMPCLSAPATAVRPPAFTIVLSQKDGSTDEFIFPIRVLVPKQVSEALAVSGAFPAGVSLILDSKYGDFYRFSMARNAVTTIVEGTRDPTQSAEQCAAREGKETIYGTNEPRDFVMENPEGDGPWRQFVFAIGCVKYSMKLQCERGSPRQACLRTLHNLQGMRDWRRELSIATKVRNNEFRGVSKRQLQSSSTVAGGVMPSKQAFSYLEPGIFHVRQYLRLLSVQMSPPLSASTWTVEQSSLG